MSIEINLPVMHPVSGFSLGTTCAGIKVEQRKDLVVMSFDASANVAGVFTQNAFCAAPVHVAKEHLHSKQAKQNNQYFVIYHYYVRAVCNLSQIEQNITGMKNCPNCGELIEEQLGECWKCSGNQIEENEMESNKFQIPISKKSNFLKR